MFCCFTSQVNSYGHSGTVSSPNHTFSWVSLNKQLTSTSCTYFCLQLTTTLLEWISGREENDRRNHFMINLHESMGPGQDQTCDPWSAGRLASVARHVTNCPAYLSFIWTLYGQTRIVGMYMNANANFLGHKITILKDDFMHIRKLPNCHELVHFLFTKYLPMFNLPRPPDKSV